MMKRPGHLRYSETHEWTSLDGDVATVGITDFAVEQLQDLVFIELPKAGARVEKGKRFGEIESVKAVSDLVAPVSGEVTAVNEALDVDLGPLASDPFGAGWLVKVRVPDRESALAGLLDEAGYGKVTAEGGH